MNQIDIIQNILKKENPIPDYRFTFGKFEGMLLENVVCSKEGVKYLEWLLTEDFITANIRTKIEKALEAL